VDANIEGALSLGHAIESNPTRPLFNHEKEGAYLSGQPTRVYKTPLSVRTPAPQQEADM
jgi:hypothetical protein